MSIIKTAITQGVKISVYPKYLSEESNPDNSTYIHGYRITIENNNPFKIQLLKRHWNIMDSIIGSKKIQGEGVVGVQPMLPPGKSFSYTSYCHLHSTIGTMGGHYQFINLDTQHLFTVKIPQFDLLMPGIYN